MSLGQPTEITFTKFLALKGSFSIVPVNPMQEGLLTFQRQKNHTEVTMAKFQQHCTLQKRPYE